MIRIVSVSIACALLAAAQQPAAKTQPKAKNQPTAKKKGTSVTHSPEFLKLVNDAKTRIKEIKIDGYKKMVASGEKHVLVDTREESEWNAGHVKGALFLSKGVIERDVEAKVPDKNTKLVLYCGGGYRSALAADNLKKMGYKDVISLDGGWRALQSSGLPLEK